MSSEDCRSFVLHRLEEKLPDVPISELEEYTDRAAEYFCSKAKRANVPMSACYLWIDMALRLYNLRDSTDGAGKVTSIKRGDTTVQYSEEQTAMAMTDIESRILDYRAVKIR